MVAGFDVPPDRRGRAGVDAGGLGSPELGPMRRGKIEGEKPGHDGHPNGFGAYHRHAKVALETNLGKPN
jgi:hypothetical protein